MTPREPTIATIHKNEVELDNIYEQNLEIVSQGIRDYIIILSDLSGSTQLSTRSLYDYFYTLVKHWLFAGDCLVNGGPRKIVKTVGDEVMLTQIAVKDKAKLAERLMEAITACAQFQTHMQRHSKDIAAKVVIHICKKVIPYRVIKQQIKDDIRLPVHRGDILGKDVALAARILSIAQEKQILISEEVYKYLFQKISSEDDNVNDNMKIVINTEGSQRQLRLDHPMPFFFKGFDENYTRKETVREIIYRKEGATLSTSGYPFYCFTHFDIDDVDQSIADTLNKIVDKFGPSLLCCFERTKQVMFPNARGMQRYTYPLTAIFWTQNNDTYRALSSQLKEESELTAYSYSLLNPPPWSKWPMLSKFFRSSNETELLFCLWRCKQYKGSLRLAEEIENSLARNNLTNTELFLNLIIEGYYDNLTVHPIEMKDHLAHLAGDLESHEILRPFLDKLLAWSVKIRYMNTELLESQFNEARKK